MPMIHCPECDGVVSDRLSKCPHCGCQIPMSKRYPQFYESNTNSYTSQPQNTGNTYQNNNYSHTPSQVNETFNPQPQYSAPPVQPVKATYTVTCPRCGSSNISYQREQTASFEAGTNKVVIQPAKKSKGCLYWLMIGWWWTPMYWLLIGWWFRPLFGGRTKSGLNFNASKSINRTMAVCQNCGHSWKA